jgi:putative SOS response-associated peptidase YedK
MFGNRTTFNARNLDSPFWQHSLKNQRALVLATGIGESKLVGKTKHQYYMQSDDVFALGALYKKHGNNKYSCAVITRDAHPKMVPYHDKAFPCFLPMDAAFFDIWLDESISHHQRIDFILQNPTLYPSLHVQRVKTYKDKLPMKSPPPAILESDLKTKLV